jgi:hypothetical protein
MFESLIMAGAIYLFVTIPLGIWLSNVLFASGKAKCVAILVLLIPFLTPLLGILCLGGSGEGLILLVFGTVISAAIITCAVVVISYGMFWMWLSSVFIESKKAKWIALSVLLSIPFWPSLFFAVLFKVVSPNPLQEIHQIVVSPESVYWQDDVRPGFDDSDRKRMVNQYLDGVHLKALALNGNNGTVYLYRADEATFAEARRLGAVLEKKSKVMKAKIEEMREVGSSNQAERTAMWERIRDLEQEHEKSPERAAYVNATKEAHQGILDRVEVLNSPAQLPPMRYRAHFKPLDHWWRKTGLCHADRISIIETASGKEIAWSQRYMKVTLSWFLFQKSPKYLSGPGDQNPYQFDDKVLFTYKTGWKTD